MERGELDGRATNPWATYKSLRPDWVAQKKIIPIIQIGLKKERDLPDVPLLRELGSSPADREAIEFISKSVAIGRPVATTPGVPPDRLAALKGAFGAMMKNADFIADVEKQKLELDPSTAQEIEQLVHGMINAAPDVRERVRQATAPPNAK
jgi:tripartite-type tricarboxylate transporter receptor subunit TctC